MECFKLKLLTVAPAQWDRKIHPSRLYVLDYLLIVCKSTQKNEIEIKFVITIKTEQWKYRNNNNNKNPWPRKLKLWQQQQKKSEPAAQINNKSSLNPFNLIASCWFWNLYHSLFFLQLIPSPLFYLISPLIKPLKLFYERGRLFMLFCHCFIFFVLCFMCVYFLWCGNQTGYVFDMFVRLFFIFISSYIHLICWS